MKWLLLALLAAPVSAETVVAARTIPPQTVLTEGDLLLRDVVVPAGIDDPSLLVGMETRVALYAGRPVNPADVGVPAVIDRNQIIALVYQNGPVVIQTEGRSLDRAGPGDLVRVINLASRNTVTAAVGVDGKAYVQ